MEHHVIKITARDDASVLNRITDVLRRKRFFVDKLTMARDARHEIMTITLIVDAESGKTEQIVRQLAKLVDVYEIDDVTTDEKGFLHEFVLVKAPETVSTEYAFSRLEDNTNVSVHRLDKSGRDTLFFGVSGPFNEVAKVIEELNEEDVYQIVRTGPLFKH